jgi:alanine-synthesizing transaminase
MDRHTFSRRTSWSLEENAWGKALRLAREQGLPLLDLTLSNPTKAGFHYNPDRILAALTQPEALTYNAESLGLPVARQAVGTYYHHRGWQVPSERIAITASTSEAYQALFQLLCDPGDEVLVPAPSYPLFSYLADITNVRLVPYPFHYSYGWHLDQAMVRQRITDKTRAIIVVSPNNPTGSYLKRHEFEFLQEMCQQHHLSLLCDEVFSDFPLECESSAIKSVVDTNRGLVFALNGLSKIAGLPQMKLGWIVCAGSEKLVAQAMERLGILLDITLSVASPVQYALPRLLELASDFQQKCLARLQSNYQQARLLTKDSSITCLEVEGGWYQPLRFPNLISESEWCAQALAAGVLVHPGYFYDFHQEPYMVLSLLPTCSTFRDGMQRLVHLCARLS